MGFFFSGYCEQFHSVSDFTATKKWSFDFQNRTRWHPRWVESTAVWIWSAFRSIAHFRQKDKIYVYRVCDLQGRIFDAEIVLSTQNAKFHFFFNPKKRRNIALEWNYVIWSRILAKFSTKWPSLVIVIPFILPGIFIWRILLGELIAQLFEFVQRFQTLLRILVILFLKCMHYFLICCRT